MVLTCEDPSPGIGLHVERGPLLSTQLSRVVTGFVGALIHRFVQYRGFESSK